MRVLTIADIHVHWAVLNERKRKKVFLYPGFPKMPTGTPCVGGWRLAIGDWRLAVDGGWWRLMVVGGSWWLGIGG